MARRPALPFLLLFAAALAFACIDLPLAVRWYAERALRAYTYDGTAAVRSVSLRLPPRLVLHGVFMHSSFYELTADEIELGFGRISIVEPVVTLHDVPPEGLIQPRRGGPALFGTLEVLELELDARLMGVRLLGRGSFEADLKSGELRMVHLAIPSARREGLVVENITVDRPYGGDGYVSVGRLSFGKAQVTWLKGPFRVQDGRLRVGPFVGELLDGAVAGSFEAELSARPSWSVSANLTRVALPAFVRAFELGDRVSLTGNVVGKIEASGGPEGVRSLRGEIEASAPGGMLVIEDASLLSDIAARTRQPIELVEAGLKEYRFDAGHVGLALADDDLDLRVELEGEKGRRHLDVRLHDLFKTPVPQPVTGEPR